MGFGKSHFPTSKTPATRVAASYESGTLATLCYQNISVTLTAEISEKITSKATSKLLPGSQTIPFTSSSKTGIWVSGMADAPVQSSNSRSLVTGSMTIW